MSRAYNGVMPDIVLATLNARWTHASLGLRYLMANLGELQSRACIEEFTLATPLPEVAVRLLAHRPRIVGLGIYIWNVTRSTELISLLRQASPGLRIVLGGPEVSHDTARLPITALADHVITGPGDLSFAVLARQLLHGPRPLSRIIAGVQPDLSALALPYSLYDETDIAHRHLYVEASRGCPFKCEFCLSALDKTAWPFPLEPLLDELQRLHARGARRFRFVDRTFNLKAATARTLLTFFLERLQADPGDPVFAHFELVPDHLPESLREIIARFPEGALQFEIGIQSWNPQVQARISRRQDNDAAQANLRWLRTHTRAHLHVDLIAGLPGEDLASFAAGFDRLMALEPHEIQVGVLKRLHGAPIARHTEAFGMRYAEQPPYEVLETSAMSANELARVRRFARYWDLYGNSGRFRYSLPALLSNQPFERFMAFSDWLHARTGLTHRLSLETQMDLLGEWLHGEGRQPWDGVVERLGRDYAASGAHGRPAFLPRGTTARHSTQSAQVWRSDRVRVASDALPAPLPGASARDADPAALNADAGPSAP